MSILRRLFGGREPADEPPPNEPPAEPVSAAELDAGEREHEIEVLRAEHERLDELQRRQLRYAVYAWEPPAQGGERRAEDNDRDAS